MKLIISTTPAPRRHAQHRLPFPPHHDPHVRGQRDGRVLHPGLRRGSQRGPAVPGAAQPPDMGRGGRAMCCTRVQCQSQHLGK